MSVIITNARNRIAYNVVRSLGQKGIEVYAADFVPRAMSFASRYSRGHFIYPSPFKYPDGFVHCLIEQIQRLRARVLIPVFEETFLIAKHANRISRCVSMVLPSYEKILVAHNKDVWAQMARRLKIPVPETHSIEDLRAGIVNADALQYPVLVKPKQGGGAWGIEQIESPRTLQILLESETFRGLPWSRFFVQEKIQGETHCVAMLFNQGKIRAKVAYKQLRDYPITGGQATIRISLRSHKAEAYFQQLLEALTWHGVCQADFVVDRKTSVPYLIDLNPRLWGSLAQAIASGVDFPHLIYCLARDGDVAPVTVFKTDVVTRWIGGELAAFLPQVRASSEKWRFLQSFLFSRPRTALYDDFSIADPLPFFVWLGDTLFKAGKYRSFGAVSYDSLDGIWE